MIYSHKQNLLVWWFYIWGIFFLCFFLHFRWIVFSKAYYMYVVSFSSLIYIAVLILEYTKILQNYRAYRFKQTKLRIEN